MKKLNQSYKFTYLFFGIIFLLLLICNIFTPLLADDYSYLNSFLSGERITNVMQIFPSLRAHAAYMNGRLVAHFWAQFFLMLPQIVFDIVNAFMFTMQIFLMYRLCKVSSDKKNNNMLILLALACIWIFQPAFGQVNLWLDGACNYLWAMTFGLLFILPFVNLFINGKQINNIFIKILFPVLSLLFGAHSENASAALIFISFLLILATLIINKKRVPILYYISFVFSVLGYLSLYLSPAQVSNKAAEFSLYVLRNNFAYCFVALKNFWILLAIFVVLLVLAYFARCDKKPMILSIIFFAGSMFANFMMMFAGYYADRSAFCVVSILAVAVLILFNELTFTNYKIVPVMLLALLMLPTCYNVVYGANDIYNTYLQDKTNREIIYNAKNDNLSEATITIPKVETKYSAAKDMHYVDPYNYDAWPNTAIAKYYGIEKIYGQWW